MRNVWLLLSSLWVMPVALAAEVQVGGPLTLHGLRVAAVYLQAVTMEGYKSTNKGYTHYAIKPAPHTLYQIHLEADIHAAQGNQNGFAVGEWIPDLRVTYTLHNKADTHWVAQGTLVPMVASDGPHYGANVVMKGPGRYTLTFHIEPPYVQGFLRHTDKNTGVGPWWRPFDYTAHFLFVGVGKIGGY